MNAKKVVDALKKGAKTDEEIAKVCGFSVNEVRRILNKLHGRCLIGYEKKFDENTGWYSFFWKIEKEI